MSAETQEAPLDRAVFKMAVAFAAWREGEDCEHCGGTGRVEGGRLLVHSILGGLGADHDVDDVLGLIERAESVRWVDGPMRHDLEVIVDTQRFYFQVGKPKAKDVPAEVSP